jgi:hypothetical protein
MEKNFEDLTAEEQDKLLHEMGGDDPIGENFLGVPYEEGEANNQETPSDEVPITEESAYSGLSQEQLDAARESLYQERQAQMQRAEQEHQARLQQIMAAEQAMAARVQAQNEPEQTELDKYIQAQIDARLQARVAPEIDTVRRQMATQQATTMVQNTLNTGLNDPNMPNFDTVAGLAIQRYGRDIVMNRIMSSSPADAARWMYQLGLIEAQGIKVAPTNTPTEPQQAIQQAQQATLPPAQPARKAPAVATPQPNLPRGMMVQGGSASSGVADWQELDRRIDAMSFDQLAEFKKNPSNAKLYERMLRFGTTNPGATEQPIDRY